MASTYPITIDIGSTFILDLTDFENINLVGATAEMVLRANYITATEIDRLTSGAEITINPGASTVTIEIPAADTAAYRALPQIQFNQACTPARARGVYDLEITETATGRVFRILQGQVSFIDEVTRP